MNDAPIRNSAAMKFSYTWPGANPEQLLHVEIPRILGVNTMSEIY